MPKALIEGLRRFRSDTFPEYRERYRTLIEEGQRPHTLFIGCADSRVLPALLVDADPGDLFIVRNVGAFVPPFAPDADYHGTAAGIEYAVLALGVTDIVVCGHSHCGAVASLYAPPNPSTPHIDRWLDLGRTARAEEWVRAADTAGGAPEPDRATLHRTEERSVALQVDRLLTYPFVEERAEAGTLALHGWHYLIEEGRVSALDVESGAFRPLGE